MSTTGYTPCDACPSHCCRNYHVLIDGFDLYRLATTLALPMESFAQLRWADEPNEKYRIVLDGKAPEKERRRFRLALRRIPDSTGVSEVRCVFLVSVGSRGRCGVYDARPQVCRVYPTSLDGAGVVGLSGGGKYCPPGGWQMTQVDVPRARLEHRRWQRDKVLYDAFVDGWNERVVGKREQQGDTTFFNLIANFFRELARTEPALVPVGEGIGADDGVAPPQRYPDDALKAIARRTLVEIGWLDQAA